MVVFCERLAGYAGVSPVGLTLRQLMRIAYGVRLRLLHQRTAIWVRDEDFDVQTFLWTGTIPGDRKASEEKFSKDDPLVDMLAAQIRINGRFDYDQIMKTAEALEKGAKGNQDGKQG